jgi:hypothetical protein
MAKLTGSFLVRTGAAVNRCLTGTITMSTARIASAFIATTSNASDWTSATDNILHLHSCQFALHAVKAHFVCFHLINFNSDKMVFP